MNLIGSWFLRKILLMESPFCFPTEGYGEHNAKAMNLSSLIAIGLVKIYITFLVYHVGYFAMWLLMVVIPSHKPFVVGGSLS